MPGMRARIEPFTRRPGMAASSRAINRSRNASMRRASPPFPRQRFGTPHQPRQSAASAKSRRRPRSCPPPENSGASRKRGRRRTNSAPTPFGPYSLWPLSESRSTPHCDDPRIAPGGRLVVEVDHGSVRHRNSDVVSAGLGCDSTHEPGRHVAVGLDECLDVLCRDIPRQRDPNSLPG